MAAARKKKAAETSVDESPSQDVLDLKDRYLSEDTENCSMSPEELSLLLENVDKLQLSELRLKDNFDRAVARESQTTPKTSKKKKEDDASIKDLITPVDDGRKFAMVLIGSIKTGRNIRKEFDPEKHQDLIESVRINGILEPLLIMDGKKSGEFELIAGERRLKAAEIAGIGEVPCFIYPELPPNRLYEIMLTENLLRADLNPVEEAEGIQLMMDLGMTQEELGQRLGRSQEFISNRLRLLAGPEILRKMIISREITPSHAMVMMPWTPYPVFDLFIQKYREFNAKHKTEHSGAIIPVKEIPNKFHTFRDGYLEGSNKTNLTLDINASFGENGDEFRKKCRECDKSMEIGSSWNKFCLDSECIKKTRKEARSASAEKRGVSAKNERAGWKEFYSENQYNSEKYPLRQTDCSCDQKVQDGSKYFCKNAECFAKMNAEKKAGIEERSKQLRNDLFTEITGLCRTVDKETLLELVIRTAFSECSYCDDRTEEGPSKMLFGAFNEGPSMEDIIRILAFKDMTKLCELRYSYRTFTDKTVRDLLKYLDRNGINSPGSIRNLIQKKKRVSSDNSDKDPETTAEDDEK